MLSCHCKKLVESLGTSRCLLYLVYARFLLQRIWEALASILSWTNSDLGVCSRKGQAGSIEVYTAQAQCNVNTAMVFVGQPENK